MLKDVRWHVDFLTAWEASQVGRNFHHLRSNIAFYLLKQKWPILDVPKYSERARLASIVWSSQSPRECRKDSLFSITFLRGQIFLGHSHWQYNFNLYQFFWYPWSEKFVLFRLNKIKHIYTDRKIWRVKLSLYKYVSTSRICDITVYSKMYSRFLLKDWSCMLETIIDDLCC